MHRTSSGLVIVVALGAAGAVATSFAQQRPAEQSIPPSNAKFQVIDAKEDSAVVFDTSTGTIHVLDDLETSWTFNPVTNTIGGGLPPTFTADRPAFREQLCANAASAIKREDWPALRACLTDGLGKRPDLATWASSLKHGEDDDGSVSKRWLMKHARFEMEDGALRIAAID